MIQEIKDEINAAASVEGVVMENVVILYLFRGQWWVYIPGWQGEAVVEGLADGSYEYETYDKTRIRITSLDRIPLLEAVLHPSGPFKFITFPDSTASEKLYRSYCWALCVKLQRLYNEQATAGGAAVARRHGAHAHHTARETAGHRGLPSARRLPTPRQPQDSSSLPSIVPAEREAVRRNPPLPASAATIRRVLDWIEKVVDDRLRGVGTHCDI